MSLLVWGLVGAPVAAVCTLTFAGFFGRYHWILDLASHFRLQYFIILAVGSMILFAAGTPVAAWIAAGFALVNLASVAPLYFDHNRKQPPAQMYRIVWANVLQPNQGYARLRDYLLASNADLVLLAETNQKWLDELRPLREIYPYTQSLPRQDNYGIAVFSRIPFERAEIHAFGPKNVPSVVAWLTLEGRPLLIIGTHPPPPKGAINASFRNRQLAELAEFVRCQTGEVVVCGDFNMAPWSPHFSSFLRQSGLRNSAQGFGFQPTWPVNRPLLRIPIDHCLVSRGVAVHSRAIGPGFGSDHFPLVVDFSIREGSNDSKLSNHFEVASGSPDGGQ